MATLKKAKKPIVKKSIKMRLSTKGLTGNNLKFVKLLNRKFARLPEQVDKDAVILEVKSMFKGLLDSKTGKMKLDMKKLNTLLGDDDKGIRAIVKKQGQEILALKNMSKEGKGGIKTFKLQLSEKMKDLEKLTSAKSGAIKLTIKAAANMTLSNTIDGHDDLPEDLIESFSLGKFANKRFPREYVFDIANRTTVAEVSQYKSWLEEGDEEGAFAIVAEGAVKPLVSYSLVRNHSEYAKVAAKYVVTEEFAKFRKNAYSIIQRLINQKILRDYSAILTTRLLADAAPYVGSALDGQYANPTDYHAIAAVAAQIEALDFMPDVLIMNPQDKWRIGMLQDNNGQFYLTIPVTDPSGQTRMMGFVVRTSNRVPVGSFILGEAGLWEVEDEAISVRIGYGIDVTGAAPVTNVSSDFDNNRFRVIVETFFHSYIATNNLGSFVLAEFDAVKELVQAA